MDARQSTETAPLPFTRSLKGRLAAYFAVAIIVSLLISGLLSVSLVQHYLRDRTISDLEAQSRSIAGQIESQGLPQESLTRDLERLQDVSVLIVPYNEQAFSGLPMAGRRGPRAELAGGHLAFIDWELLETGETLTTEAEIPGLDKEAVAAAHGIESDGELVGAVVVSQPVDKMQPWRPLAGEFLVAALIALVISLLFALLLARRLSRPLHEITQAAVAVADGDFSQGVSVSSEDEIGQLADAFRHMTAAVQQSQEQQRQFVINVSHELKTPLTAISGHARALQDGVAGDPETMARSIEVINAEAARLSRLIDDLISLAKFDASQFELHSASTMLGEVVQAAADGFTQKAAEQGVELIVEREHDQRIMTDPDRLRQILSNLVENALAHTPAGGTVTIAGRPGEGMANIEVSDSGSGIKSGDLANVFDRFYRSSPGSAEPGMGLGLSISRELARAMGGEITVASVEGEGATFTVSLPHAGEETPPGQP